MDTANNSVRFTNDTGGGQASWEEELAACRGAAGRACRCAGCDCFDFVIGHAMTPRSSGFAPGKDPVFHEATPRGAETDAVASGMRIAIRFALGGVREDDSLSKLVAFIGR